MEIKCPKCGETFNSEQEMLDHYSLVHEGLDPKTGEPVKKPFKPKKEKLREQKIIVSIVLPGALLIATIIFLYQSVPTLWNSRFQSTLYTNAMLSFFGSLMLYVFLWGALYYLYRLSNNL